MRGRDLVCAFEWCNCAAILRIREEAMRDVGEDDNEYHLRMPYSEYTVIGRAFAAPSGGLGYALEENPVETHLAMELTPRDFEFLGVPFLKPGIWG
jgi:hypothetical protein